LVTRLGFSRGLETSVQSPHRFGGNSMPRISSDACFEKLKENIEVALKLREQGWNFKDIGVELDVSAPMAWNYVNKGLELLKKYEPTEEQNTKWEEVAESLKKA